MGGYADDTEGLRPACAGELENAGLPIERRGRAGAVVATDFYVIDVNADTGSVGAVTQVTGKVQAQGVGGSGDGFDADSK